MIPFFTAAAVVMGQTALFGEVTFERDIAPIVYQNCAPCHRPGEAAPFGLLSFAEVTKKGKLIAKVTASRYMPPWKAEPGSYAFRDERRLTEAQITAIQEWVKGGMPQGDGPKCEPPKFASGWRRSEERRVGKECRSRWSPYH